ncbi:CxC2-like cysteine cluster KDZ transposase-associated domain-containing protein [Pleurotus pulmonarius]
MRPPKRLRVQVDNYEGTAHSTPPVAIRSHTNYVCSNNRLSSRRSYHACNTTPLESATHPDSANTNVNDNADNEDTLFPSNDGDDCDYEDPIIKTRMRKRTFAGDNPMLVWMEERDSFIQEFLRLEAPDTVLLGSTTPDCADCLTSTGLYRCPQCFDVRLFCQPCIVNHHAHQPFHTVEVWNSQFFERCTLRSLGLRVQLGHPIGGSCINPDRTHKDGFTVITSHGIVVVNLDFCGCSPVSRPTQLLRARLFPATTIEPRTAATFEVLRLFQLLTFGSKVSGFEFYQCLSRLTDNLGDSPPDRYNAFMRIVRQWRHIRAMKRFGRGHDPSGVGGTREGECAVLCPACPHPGKNLPDDYSNLPASQAWIYSLFLAIDANFRLKRLSASNDIRDPGLNQGFAYFVEEKKYKEFLAATTDLIATEASTCSNYDAVKLANIRGGHGVSASGVGAIECARHDMKRPVSVGDLQLGEKYANMDYLYFSSIRNHSPTTCVVSYDIVCQWTRKLGSRAVAYPSGVVDPTFHQTSITYLIPKFHIYAHRDECQYKYSFNFTPHVGRTDGESPERGWAAMNPVSSSTKEMGPGSRRDTLDDHFGDYNWRKVISMHLLLLRKAQEAVAMRAEHVAAFKEFSASLPGATTLAFSKQVWAYEAGQLTQNPYEPKLAAQSQAKVRLQLAEEDSAAISRDDNLVIHETVSRSVLILQGLELQDQQTRLALDAKTLGVHITEHQQSQLVERRNRLQRRIAAWCRVQELYMPGVVPLRATTENTGGGNTHAEHIKLFLPSEVIASIRFDHQLARLEWRLRYGQVFDHLAELRRHLLVLSTMYQSKDNLSRGQKSNTRSVTLIKNIQARINYVCQKYRSCRSALVALSGPLEERGWESLVQPLLDADVRSLKEGDNTGNSEGRRQLSWIWSSQRTSDAELTEGMNEALRIEWCKARARAQRWQEECILLREEMSRVIKFHQWQADTWETRAIEATLEGHKAYAWRQRQTRLTLIVRCRRSWEGIDGKIQEGEGAVLSAGNSLVECHTRVDV